MEEYELFHCVGGQILWYTLIQIPCKTIYHCLVKLKMPIPCDTAILLLGVNSIETCSGAPGDK